MPTSQKDNQLNKYEKKSDREHILDNPDTYIGSVELIESSEFILNKDNIIEKQNIQYNPGLYKLFDEGIVNCRDHVVRMQESDSNTQVTYIDITIDSSGLITMINDGNGIDVALHPEYKVWIPELIFAHLRTSTNYDKQKEKITGGKNGFGVKLLFIWSTYGIIETIDQSRGLKYTQEFNKNLESINEPKIIKCKNKPYTKIQFMPDYERLGFKNGLTDDMISIFKRRIYDIASVTDKSVKVKYNSNLIPVKNFLQYIKLIVGDKEFKHEESNERWEYAVSLSTEGEFMQMSYVNGIYTSKGGKHIDYVVNQIITKLKDYIKEKKKVDVKPSAIKEQLFIFLRCDIINPSYDSQTKDYMNTPSSKFGSTPKISDKFIEKIAKMGIMDSACAITEIKDNKSLKKNDGTKCKSVRGITKLIDANNAGTSKSDKCTLILCEGDSAKAGVISGLTSDDRNWFGVYPMKGKILNVRGEPLSKIGDNKEINEIKQILGLELQKVYTQLDVKNKLRYGKILFMTDQDLDGSHIKGLGINLFDSGWPSLIEIPGFISFMNTPILKANKGKESIQFYNEGEFELWKSTNSIKGWNIKYYKGLGTSTANEFKEYFKEKRFVDFVCSGKTSKESLDMIFNKKRSDDRKNWLSNYDKNLYLDTTHREISYENFVNKEFIHFSKADCERSINNLYDGLKTSLRKILYSAFKKNLTSEIKVAQFSGYVSEHSGYHHGEASLNAAIVGLAQTFIGSNNINIFKPNGQFGTRLKGGKDAASERYIFTELSSITKYIFIPEDNNILEYNYDDGDMVEPVSYIPIIPMVLVNGAIGIGTGFSTFIPQFNPLDLINNLLAKLLGDEINDDLLPWYKDFTGSVEEIYSNSHKKFLIKGKFEKINNNVIKITELPVGYWTEDFKEHIETFTEQRKKESKPLIKNFKDNGTDTTVDITIEFFPNILDGLLIETEISQTCNKKITELEKLFKLYNIVSTSNMHLFDENEQLHKYNTVKDIQEKFFKYRLNMYTKRKNYLISKLEKEVKIANNIARFIKYNLEDKIDLRKKKNDQVIKILSDYKFDLHEDDKNYNYLIKMPLDSVTEENVEKINLNMENKLKELDKIKNTDEEDMWIDELNILKDKYKEFLNEKNYTTKVDKKTKPKNIKSK